MRLQLMILVGLALPVVLFSQEKEKVPPIDVNFLFSYYDQDGDHSAVTGGVGTEKLEDYASKIIINIPLDSVSSLSIHTHINYYSSASTDRIDANVSSASSDDLRTQMDMTYSKSNRAKNQSYSLSASGSFESDYISTSVAGQWVKESKDANKEFSILGQAYFDHWRLIFPDELRTTAQKDVDTDKRRTFSLSFSYSQVFTERFLAGVTTDLVFQHGLLSTPFHRVYFTDNTVRIEKLPKSRMKLPVGLRLNYFFGDHLITRFYYRFYIDNFGIMGNTISLETPIKIAKVISIYPFYRFHYQTASDYFLAYGLHEADDLFYTSDYDLSELFNHKVGIGLSYSPESGIRKIDTKSRFRFKRLGLRFAQYFRSDDLEAFIVSLQVGMEM